ncbi:MAG: serine hydrolase [Clostridiales bacterium]|nr:serine hydrolase [Clostridiales bacterium]
MKIDLDIINKEWFEKLMLQFENEKKINIKSCLVIKNGKMISSYSKEPYSIDERNLLFSMTKSFSSLAIGIASDKGYLELDDKIINIFPDKLPLLVSKHLKNIKIRDLLVMASGIHHNTYTELYHEKDWIKAFLGQEFQHEPGTYYRYSTHGSHMLSAVIKEKTGYNLLDFLNINLFSPLGIEKPQWEIAPDGYIAGGMGLSLCAKDIAKIGQLLLDKGLYNGTQVISRNYLDAATSVQIIKHSELDKLDREILGKEYGYQFHIDKFGNYRMDGAFGQLCLVLNDYNTVIVVTSTDSKMETLHKVIYESFENEFACISNSEVAKLVDSSIFNPNSNWYFFTPLVNGIKEIDVLFDEKHIKILYHTSCNDEETELIIQRHSKYTGHTSFVKDIQNHTQKFVSEIINENESMIQIRVWYVETPYIEDYVLRKDGNKVSMEYDINVSFTKKSFIVEAMSITN